MLYLLGVLFVVVGVAVSIGLHEIGHLVPAKRFGVKVTQYMVGFGPTLWSRTRGETEYGVKAIPLGGYIRMIGMYPPRPGDDEHTLRASSTGRMGALADQVRQESLEEIGPGDEDRVFYKLAIPKRIVVMLGGPLMNLVIAAVLLTGIVTIYGIPQEKSASVASVSSCVARGSATKAPATCPAGPSPARAAGLETGDRIVSIDGRAITTSAQAGAAIRANGGGPLQLIVDRKGKRVPLTAHPVQSMLPAVDANGNAVLSSSGQPTYTRRYAIGISIVGNLVNVRQPISSAPGFVGSAVAQTAGVFLRIPQKLVGVAHAAFGSGTRDANGPISVVGVGRIAGSAADASGVSLADRLAFLISLIASLNLALFVFNLVPLLPLDGGHVAGALWESVKRGWARLRGRPRPAYVDVAKALPLAYAVSMALIVVSALLIYADIVNPVKLGG